MRAYVTRALEFGLLPRNLSAFDNANLQQLLDTLRMVPQRLAAGELPAVDVGAGEGPVLRVRELEDEEERLARDLSRINRRRLQIERLKGSVASYGDQLLNQEARMIGVGWIANRLASDDNCPFCGNASDAAKDALDKLVQLAEEMQQLSASTSTATPALERETARLRGESMEVEGQLRSVRDEKWHLEDASVELAERRRTEMEAFRLAGRVDQLLRDPPTNRR